MSKHDLKVGDRVRVKTECHPSRRFGDKGTVELIQAAPASKARVYDAVRMDGRPDERLVIFLADEIEPDV
jgi:hypothetical protein